MGTNGIPSNVNRNKSCCDLDVPKRFGVKRLKQINNNSIREAMRRLGERSGESVVRTEGDMKFIAEQTEKLKEALAKGDLSLIDELLQEGQNLEGKIKPVPMPKPKIGGGIDGVEVKPAPMPEPKIGGGIGGVEVKPAPMPEPKIGNTFDGVEVNPVPMPEPKIGNTFNGVEVKPLPLPDFTPNGFGFGKNVQVEPELLPDKPDLNQQQKPDLL